MRSTAGSSARRERPRAEVTAALDEYRFNEAAGAIYQFAWGTFCDWYLEFIKPVLAGEDAALRDEARAASAWALGEILKMLHPFMPFVSEEIWQRTRPADAGLLALEPWPTPRDTAGAAEAAEEMEWAIRLISRIRAARSEMNVPPGAKLALHMVGAGEATRARLARHREAIARLGRFHSIEIADAAPAGSVQLVVDEATAALPLAEVIDIARERERLGRELDKVALEITRIDGKLGNDQFVAKAPGHVVAEQRERRADAEAVHARLTRALERLRAAG